jgi:hypothetical protein
MQRFSEMRNRRWGFVVVMSCSSGMSGCGGPSGSASDDDQEPADGAAGSDTEHGATDDDVAAGSGNGVQQASAPPLPNYIAGTRLAPRVVTVEPGLVALLEVDDTELGVPCRVGLAEDLVQRCLPQTTTNVTLRFADAACTEYRGIWETEELCGAEPPPVVTSWVFLDDPCDGGVGLRRVGEVPPSSELYQWLDGECVASPSPTQGVVVYALERVPPESFVAIDRSPAPRSSELGVVGWAGEDGSFFAVSLYDPRLGSTCSRWSQPADRCVPHVASVTAYVGAECSPATLLTNVDNCSPERPVALLQGMVVVETQGDETQEDETDCDGQVLSLEFFELGEVREAVMTHTLSAGECTPVDSDDPAPLEWVLAGDRIDPSSFPLLETFELGSGAVHMRFDGIAGEPYLPALYPLLDAKSGLHCEPRLFADGAHYCLPVSFLTRGDTWPRGWYYADASCTGQRLERWSRDPCIPSLLVVVSGDGQGSACDGDPIHETRLVIGEANPSEVYLHDPESGACEPVDLTETTLGDGTPQWLLLGEPISPEERFGRVEIGRLE